MILTIKGAGQEYTAAKCDGLHLLSHLRQETIKE